MTRLELEIRGKKEIVIFENLSSVLWYHWRGETFCLGQERPTHKSGELKQDLFEPELCAPMPGKIIRILVKPGDLVEARQVLLVLEAMKMEYSLKASVDCIVSKLHCHEGQIVELDQILVELEK